MAEPVATALQPLTRDHLARIGLTHEGIKFFENLVRDVTATLPQASFAAAVSAEGAQSTADGATTAAADAASTASTAQAAADDALAAALLAQAAADDAIAQLEALVAELNQQLAVIWDQDAEPPTVAYKCEALPGASAAAAVWRVQKITYAVGGDYTVQWADGNANFDNVANDRASLTYS